MAPVMFKYNCACRKQSNWLLVIKADDTTHKPQTCAEKYSQYAKGIQVPRIAPTNCTKVQHVYNSRGQLMGKNFCVSKNT